MAYESIERKNNLIDLSQELLLNILLSAFLLGVSHGILYEGIRLVRLIFEPNAVISNITTHVTDFAFIVLFALVAILHTYKMSGGIFRGLSYVGMITGFMIYYFTLGRLTLKISKRIARIIRKSTCKLFKILFIPIRLIFSLVFKVYTLTIYKKIGKIKCKGKEAREKRQNGQNKATLIAVDVCQNEKGYKKEGRVSFGEKRKP